VFLVNDVGLTAVTSNSVLTVYVSAMTVGVLVGGVVSDRVSPYVVVPLVFALTAFSVFRVTRGGFVSIPLSVYGWFAVAGLFNGLALPSRDRLMNSFSTRASVGRSFGFAFTGVSLGALVSPVLLGFVFDTAGPSVGFGVVAALFVSAALVVLLAMFVRAGHVATPEPVEN
jgi:MFS family permease